MFSSSSRFRDISCPMEQDCALPNCIFKHTSGTAQRKWQTNSIEHSLDSAPPTKRQKIESLVAPKVVTPQAPAQPKPAKPFTGALVQKKATTKHEENPVMTTVPEANSLANQAISPPPAGRHTGKALPPTKAESLNPRMLKTQPPAGHAIRLLYLKKLHEGMTVLNERLLKEGDDGQKKFHMTSNELVRYALDEEERMARDNPAVYANIIKMSMVEHKKMSLDAWVAKRKKSTASSRTEAADSSLDTGLSPLQETLILPYLIAQQDGLEEHGYITSIPSDKAVSEARAAIAVCDYWEKCERCSSRFQVFPDRRSDGALTGGGSCTHHPMRPVQPPKKPGTKGAGTKIYPCCNEPIGNSQGCETGDTHVYKYGDANRLASVMQFESTPENPNVPDDRVVCFDCEMGWTTKGMELIRLTAVSWPSADVLLDILVKPLGNILDLNSRFSGVQPGQFASAQPYDGASESAEKNDGLLKIVDSPQTARRLLFGLLKPSTPLIGHAIENDLIAVRIVHPCIIDTVLLYPMRNGLPYRKSLKGAAKELLGRSIQGGGAAGHDSLEDAKATGDLVRLKVKTTWAEMRRREWTMESDKLVLPSGSDEYESQTIIAQRLKEHVLRQQAAEGISTDKGEHNDSPGR